MHRHRHTLTIFSAVTIAAFGLAISGSSISSAAEFCVSCEQPNAQYACVLPGPASDAADSRLKLWCITELAKAGQHASCAVDRQQQTPCKGDVKQLAMPEGLDIGSTPPSGDAAPAPGTPQTGAPASDPLTQQPKQHDTTKDTQPASKPPTDATAKPNNEDGASPAEKAIDDTSKAASDAAKAAGSTVEKAGKAVGDAAKKTWTCITSLFGEC